MKFGKKPLYFHRQKSNTIFTFNTWIISMKIEWTATISTKWQIVIPQSARKKFDLQIWDDLIVLSSKNGLMLIKSDNLENMMDDFEEMIKIDEK